MNAKQRIAARIASLNVSPAINEFAQQQEIERLCSVNVALLAALERAESCLRGLINRIPVRDVSETLAEINHAIKKARPA